MVFAVFREFSQISEDIFGLNILAVLSSLGLDGRKLFLGLGLVPADDANVEALIREISAELFADAVGTPCDYSPGVALVVDLVEVWIPFDGVPVDKGD